MLLILDNVFWVKWECNIFLIWSNNYANNFECSLGFWGNEFGNHLIPYFGLNAIVVANFLLKRNNALQIHNWLPWVACPEQPPDLSHETKVFQIPSGTTPFRRIPHPSREVPRSYECGLAFFWLLSFFNSAPEFRILIPAREVDKSLSFN